MSMHQGPVNFGPMASKDSLLSKYKSLKFTDLFLIQPLLKPRMAKNEIYPHGWYHDSLCL